MAIAGFLDRMCLALRASGLWLRYATLQNLIPSFPWIAPPRPPPWRNPRKGRDQILRSGNHDLRDSDEERDTTVAAVPGDQIRIEDKLYSTEKLANLHPGGPLFVKVFLSL